MKHHCVHARPQLLERLWRRVDFAMRCGEFEIAELWMFTISRLQGF